MRVLIADDDRAVCGLLERYVERCGHIVIDAVSAGGLAAIQSFARHEPDLVFLDITMPQLSGRTACLHMLSRKPAAKIIFVSGTDLTPEQFDRSGAVDFLAKPFTFAKVQALLDEFSLPVAA